MSVQAICSADQQLERMMETKKRRPKKRI